MLRGDHGRIEVGARTSVQDGTVVHCTREHPTLIGSECVVGRAVSILDVGGMHLRANQVAAGIGNDVALAPIDLLARIIAPRASAFRGLDRLTVDTASTGGCFSPCRYTNLLA